MAVDPLALYPVITDAGLAACFRAQGDGVHLELSQVAVGRGVANGGGWKGYTPVRSQTALKKEDVRVPILSGSKLDGQGFRVLAQIPRTTDGSEMPVNEVGWFLATGELLCVWSTPDGVPLTARTPRAEVHLAHELYLAQLPLGSLNITVMLPDIPDTAGVLAGLLSAGLRTFIADIEAERRAVARGIY